MKKLNTLILTLGVIGIIAFPVKAQLDGPPNPELGKCYAKCYIPDVWETVTETVIDKHASSYMTTTPAVYETKTEQVLVKEASKKFVYVPAVYEMATERRLVKEASKKLVPVPATYETVTEKIMTKEASSKWIKKKATNCLSENPDDCMVLCWVEEPATYRTVTSRVEKTPATTREIEIPEVYDTQTSRVIKTPARYDEIEIPAQYKTVTRRILKTNATSKKVPIPETTKTISRRVLKTKGGFTEWKEVLCDDKMTSYTISQIQRALIAKGYDVGTYGVDNILGKDTRVALLKYQKDNNLPQGNVNMETLKHLGVTL